MIEDELEKLAEKIATYANGENVIFKDRLDSFKALTAYHFNKNNAKKKPEEGEVQGETFDGFRERVAATAGGGGSHSPLNGDASTIDIPSDLAPPLRPTSR